MCHGVASSLLLPSTEGLGEEMCGIRDRVPGHCGGTHKLGSISKNLPLKWSTGLENRRGRHLGSKIEGEDTGEGWTRQQERRMAHGGGEAAFARRQCLEASGNVGWGRTAKDSGNTM